MKKIKKRKITKYIGGEDGHPLGGSPTPPQKITVEEFALEDVVEKVNEIVKYLYEKTKENKIV